MEKIIIRFDEYKNLYYTIRQNVCAFNLNFLNNRIFENYKVELHEITISDATFYDIDIIQKIN